MNIDTSEEYFNKYSSLHQFEEGDTQYLIDKEDFRKAMVEFATLHVKAALNTVADEVATLYDGDYFEQMIREGYPESNIK